MNQNMPQTLIVEQKEEKKSFKFSGLLRPKVIFLALSLILLVEVFFAIRSLQGLEVLPKPVPPLPITGGSFELLAFGSQYKVGDKILVQARLSSGGNSAVAADLILHFDPKALSLAKNDLKVGKVFSSFPAAEVDEKEGIVRISGVSGNESFVGLGIMAEMQFKAKSSGKTRLSVEFKEGATSDSNIVVTDGKDILGKPQDLELEIL